MVTHKQPAASGGGASSGWGDKAEGWDAFALHPIVGCAFPTDADGLGCVWRRQFVFLNEGLGYKTVLQRDVCASNGLSDLSWDERGVYDNLAVMLALTGRKYLCDASDDAVSQL